tara:strand:+ start:499 stop:798 length:300 start_codon:yes stop_codon:yes gene_type:complete
MKIDKIHKVVKMSVKKNSAKEKNKEIKKVDTGKSEAKKASEKNLNEKTRENSSDKLAEAPKSTSQISISHFSSVSTKEYRSGWTNIFGKKKYRSSKNKC